MNDRIYLRELVCAGLSFLLSSSAWSFQPLITDDTGTQGAGANQIDVSFSLQRDSVGGTGGETTTRALPFGFTRGLNKNLDVYVGAAHQRIQPDDGAGSGRAEDGWGNVGLGAKWRFYENEVSRLSLALKPEIQVAVSDDMESRGLGTGRTSYSVALIASQETSFGALHFNLAANRVNYALQTNREALHAEQYRISVAPVWQFGDTVKLALDMGIRSNPDVAQRRWLGYAEVGLALAPSADLDLAMGVIRTNGNGHPDSTQALVGLTWRFK